MTESVTIPVFTVAQPIGTFYTGVMRASRLLEICKFDFRRIHENGGRKVFLGIQRELKDKRTKEIARYIRTSDAVFPTSIVISVDERCASAVEDKDRISLNLSAYVDSEDPRLNVPFDSIATIIDGQHRLKSFEGIDDLEFDLPVSIFVGVDEATQATVFSTVNLAQTKVNKSLVYDLFSLDRDRSPEKTCHEIAVAFDELSESPFSGKIKRLGTATEGRFGETLSQATIVKGILPFITNDPVGDRDIGKRLGFWPDRGTSDFERRPLYPFFREGQDERILANLINFFRAAAARWPVAWENSGRGAVLSKTNGYNGLMRFFRDAYLYSTGSPSVVSESSFKAIFARSGLDDGNFTTATYAPGSSGSSQLYRDLMRTTGVDRV